MQLHIIVFFAAEGLWLAYLLTVGRTRDTAIKLSVARPAIALVVAAMLIAPLAAAASRVEIGALHAGVLEWIEPQPPWWPFRALKVMTGNAAFWPFLALSIFGIWRQRIQTVQGTIFIICWLALPFVIVMVISYAITPFMLERYVLSGLAAFLVLAAVGLASFRSKSARYPIAALVVAQSLAHVHHHWRAPEDIQWRDAGAPPRQRQAGKKSR